MSRHRGKVKWFDPKKGYGFIYGPDNQDVFFHHTAINGQKGFRTVGDGAVVEYELGKVEGRGWQARDVVQLADAPPPDGSFVPHDPDSGITDEEAARRAQQIDPARR